ncbi:MAG: zinc ABC transporter substrate-binding protein [Firmicutes bacterium]|nr:zinc ABC transporter substrate-binding protein [Bacillota bacterium]
MKKLLILVSLSFIFLTTGCFKRDTMEDITIYTTVYPIEYITSRLYGENSEVLSIYPDGTVANEYKLTEKQIKDYSKAELFIFNGLSEEKNYVSNFFEHNKNIKIIDTTSSMEVTNRVEELWLNPSNLLMLAQNVKRGFEEYINNHYLKNSIEENYELLKLDISNLDARMSAILSDANNKTIVVSDDLFLFLTKYGFNVISLDPDTRADKNMLEVKNLIANNQINYIFAPINEEVDENINSLIEGSKVKVSYLHTLSTITENERNSKKDYITIMNENIEILKNEIYD